MKKRKVYIREDALSLIKDKAIEADEYAIGKEPNSPAGGAYYHVVEESFSNHIGLSRLNRVEYTPLESDEDGEEYFDEVVFKDIDDDTIYEDYTISKEELAEILSDYPSVYQGMINSEGRRVANELWIEDIAYSSLNNVGINNPDAVDDAMKKLATNSGPSGYILRDGNTLWFAGHEAVQAIDGMTIEKYLSMGNIRVSSSGFEIMRKPTRNQMVSIKRLVSYMDDSFYVDFCEPSPGHSQPTVLFAQTYNSNSFWQLENDIEDYFDNGNKPGHSMYESLRPMDSKNRLALLDLADSIWYGIGIAGTDMDGIYFSPNQNVLYISLDYSNFDGSDKVINEYFSNELSKIDIPEEITVKIVDKKEIENIDSEELYDLERNELVFESMRIGLVYESICSLLNEEVVADGDSRHNPYAKRWKQERDAFKDFLIKYGKLMTSKENGKTYKVYYDQVMSELIGYEYCVCLQYDPYTGEEGTTVYIRAVDKFTERLFKPDFDTRGNDNIQGTSDDFQKM